VGGPLRGNGRKFEQTRVEVNSGATALAPAIRKRVGPWTGISERCPWPRWTISLSFRQPSGAIR
jgi:hypothetical protein